MAVEPVDLPLNTTLGGSYWLDDLQSEAARTWVGQQQRMTDDALDATGLREDSRRRVHESVDRAWAGLPVTRGSATFQLRRSVGEEQPSLWLQTGGQDRLLIDPAVLDPTGTTSISLVEPSPDGRLVAWAAMTGGSDWQVIRVRDVASGVDLPDRLHWVKAPQAAWDQDATGFSYLAFAPPAEGRALVEASGGQRLLHHSLGTPQADDTVLFQHPTAHWLSVHAPAELGQLVVEVIDGTTTVEILAADARTARREGTEAFSSLIRGDVEVSYLGATRSDIVCCTFEDSSDGRVLILSSDDARELHLPEGPVDVWRSVVTQNHVVAAYHSGADLRLGWASVDGSRRGALQLPEGAWVREISAVEGTDRVRLRLGGNALGSRLVEITVPSGSTAVLSDDLELDRNLTARHHATSADGTRVPYDLVTSQSDPDGPAPTLLVGYGGYGADFLTYGFEPWHQAWLDLGGRLVLMGLRGGSEHGETWHEQATRGGKQRSYDDALAIAEDLVRHGVSTPTQLAINGMSNGGLMVGAILTQRPELFGAAVPEVGVMDLLRFHEFTVGGGWIREFGDPDDPDDRQRLESLSPLHQLRQGTAYPPTLVVTADRDDRVVPGPHSCRFLERLQELSDGQTRHLLRVEPDAGHAAGKRSTTVVRERGDILTFLRTTIAG